METFAWEMDTLQREMDTFTAKMETLQREMDTFACGTETFTMEMETFTAGMEASVLVINSFEFGIESLKSTMATRTREMSSCVTVINCWFLIPKGSRKAFGKDRVRPLAILSIPKGCWKLAVGKAHGFVINRSSRRDVGN